nr:lysine-rich arabinogalactan protein 19-like [Lolium perenne]
MENLPQPKAIDHPTQPAKIPETSAKKTVRNAMSSKLLDNLPQQLKTMDHPTQPAKIPETPAKKKTVEITTNRASDPVAPGSSSAATVPAGPRHRGAAPTRVTRELVWLDQLPTLLLPRATLLPRAATLLLPRAATLLLAPRPHLPVAGRPRTSPSPAASQLAVGRPRPHLPVAGRPAPPLPRPPSSPRPALPRPPSSSTLPFPGRPPPCPPPSPAAPPRPPPRRHTAPRRPSSPPAARRSDPLLPQHTAPAPSFRSDSPHWPAPWRAQRHRREHPDVTTRDLDAIRSGHRHRHLHVRHRHAILSVRRG